MKFATTCRARQYGNDQICKECDLIYEADDLEEPVCHYQENDDIVVDCRKIEIPVKMEDLI